MTNQYTGEVSVVIGGKDCTLIFDWSAISQLHNDFPDDLRDGLLDVNQINDPFKLAKIAAIGFKQKNPEVTFDSMQAIRPQPSIVMLKKKLDEALAISYFGSDLIASLKKAADMLNKQPAEVKKKKKLTT